MEADLLGDQTCTQTRGIYSQYIAPQQTIQKHNKHLKIKASKLRHGNVLPLSCTTGMQLCHVTDRNLPTLGTGSSITQNTCTK